MQPIGKLYFLLTRTKISASISPLSISLVSMTKALLSSLILTWIHSHSWKICSLALHAYSCCSKCALLPFSFLLLPREMLNSLPLLLFDRVFLLILDKSYLLLQQLHFHATCSKLLDCLYNHAFIVLLAL